jgi:ferredoxin-NADP reductase
VTVAVSSGAETLQRCYTIASSPARSDYCELTVKRDGQVSALLHDTYIAGSRLQVSGPMGRFTFDGNDARAIVMIAGGVGLTPLMSKLRFLSDTQWTGNIDLIYSAKSGCEVIFERELREIERAMENIRVHVTVTGEDAVWTGARGRLTAARIATLVPNIADDHLVHLCGPMEMAAATQKMLHELGVAESRIEIEAFGGPRSPTGQGGEQEVRFARSGRSAIVAGGQSLLDAALAAGVPLDHGCRAGVCGRCRTRVIEGEVAVTCDFVLTPEQKSQRIVLACQAHPMGPVSLDC